jgi:hypothetical protein
LLFLHLWETVLLLSLEVLLVVGLNAATQHIKLPDGLIDWTDRAQMIVYCDFAAVCDRIALAPAFGECA